MNIKKMTYKQLETQVIKNRQIIRTSTDQKLVRALIAENHNMMIEMDNRWNKAK